MKSGMRFVVAMALFALGLGDTMAQGITTQPPVPVANSPFVALVPVSNSPFLVNAGFIPGTLIVQGKTISVTFGACVTCATAPAAGPFPLSVPALPAGNYTLDVAIPGFSPSFPDQFFSFAVGASGASVTSLPMLTPATLLALLTGCIILAARAMRRRDSAHD